MMAGVPVARNGRSSSRDEAPEGSCSEASCSFRARARLAQRVPADWRPAVATASAEAEIAASARRRAVLEVCMV